MNDNSHSTQTTPSMHSPDHQVDGAESAAPDSTIYTCPMHPEVRQDHPGNCPMCGMTLEPELPRLDDDDNPELRDF